MLSISIVTYQEEPSELENLMASLVDSVDYLRSRIDCEVWLYFIDNGDQQDTIISLCNKYKESPVKICNLGQYDNLGYGKAHNLAIRRSTSRYHLILNPDVILERNSLFKGFEFLTKNENVTCVAPQVLNQQANPQHLCKNYPSLFDLFLRGFAPEFLKKIFKRRLESYELRDLNELTNEVEVPIVSGCFMLCEAEKLKLVSGFDENYFLYFEDFALSMELKKTGKLMLLPEMKIQHFGGNTAGKGTRHIMMFMSSALKFYSNYGWKLF